ncbi:MAG: esterase [Lewinella sp.]|uniref:esterase n=1 Tax=Lewinella sp. TaxID=2004506 RepID=UPI003D6A4467
MKKFFLLSTLFITFWGANAYGQQWGPGVTSPEIHEDNSVTFWLLAPDADSVFVIGDFLPTVKVSSPMGEVDGPGKVPLQQDEYGRWSYRTDPLSAELYSYAFVVNGLTIIDPANSFVNRDIATLSSIFVISEGEADLYTINDVPHGTVSRQWYESPGLNIDRRMTVYTPPGYESSGRKYPVLYLLHGAGGDEEAWMSLGRTAQIMDNLLAQGKIKPMIVVMPNGNVIQDAAPGEGNKGFYKPQFMVPKTMDGTYEMNFMDIVRFVENNYRVFTDKANRAVAGLSMGGFHALHLSRYYPNTFDYVGLFSAAILNGNDANGKVYADIDGTLTAQMENGYKLYWMGIGKTDFLYKVNQDFRRKLDGIGMEYVYVETEGGHIWRNWRVYLSQFVPLLFQ